MHDLNVKKGFYIIVDKTRWSIKAKNPEEMLPWFKDVSSLYSGKHFLRSNRVFDEKKKVEYIEKTDSISSALHVKPFFFV